MSTAFERIDPGCVALRCCVPGVEKVSVAWPDESVSAPPTLAVSAGDRLPFES